MLFAADWEEFWRRKMPDFEDEEEALRLTLSPPGRGVHNPEPGSVLNTQNNNPQANFPEEIHRNNKTQNFQIQSRERPQSSGEETEKKVRRIRQACSDRAVPNTGPKEEQIAPPYPWATDRRATIHSLEFLNRCGICSIRGDVICKRCDGQQILDINLHSSFLQISAYFLTHRDTMHDRAPKCWTVPRLLDCSLCLQSDCVKPIIHSKKRSINWLFLLLTQTLGLCTLDQLKYFCKHTRRHRTGAKDRVLYLTYVGLLKQLNPSAPYE